MRVQSFLFMAVAALLPAPSIGAPAPSPIAETLLADYASAADPGRLTTLLRLQLAAGRWHDAEEVIDRLSAHYAPIQPARAASLVPWRIYARARRYEMEGAGRAQALNRAFAEIFSSLPDEEMARALASYGASIDNLRGAQTRAAEACRSMAVDACPASAELIAARQATATWTYLMPASQPLLRAEIERRFIVEDDLLLPMPDGARVAAILVRPRQAQGKLTALLNFTIYARDEWAVSDAVEMAARGYAGMVAYTRGKGRSQDPAVPYEHDGADAAAVIEWLAAQGWSDGRVGMFSGSYNASTQWGAVKHRPSALRAIATHASNAPGIDTPMQGNVFQNFIYPWPLYTTDTLWLDEINYGDRSRWDALDRNWYASGRPYRDLAMIDGHPNPIFATWLEHPSYDSYWQRFIPVGEEFAGVDIPVFVATGYFDGGMVGALHYFREHLRHRPGADHRMLIGPYHHVAMGQGVLTSVNGYEVDRAALIDLKAVRMDWFDHVFRGAPLPAILRARVNFQVMGANRWRHVDELDAMASDRLRLYLGAQAAGGRYPLVAAPPAVEAGPELSVDFADRSDADFVPPENGLDTRNALLFVTAPIDQPLEIAGAFRGRFEIVANKRDFDLSVAFFEQLADGRVLPLASYLGRVSYMEDRSVRRLLVPGQPRTLSFESQTVTGRRLAPGSRIVALIGVPKRPDIQINYGTGRDVSDESVADAGEALRVRWRGRSYLELAVTREP